MNPHLEAVRWFAGTCGKDLADERAVTQWLADVAIEAVQQYVHRCNEMHRTSKGAHDSQAALPPPTVLCGSWLRSNMDQQASTDRPNPLLPQASAAVPRH